MFIYDSHLYCTYFGSYNEGLFQENEPIYGYHYSNICYVIPCKTG